MKKIKQIAIIAGVTIFFNLTMASANNESESGSMMQVPLKGIVIDKNTGEPLTGVAVKVNNETVYTDFEGNFEINDLYPGEYDLQVSYISYKNVDKTLNIMQQSNNSVKFEIEPLTK